MINQTILGRRIEHVTALLKCGTLCLPLARTRPSFVWSVVLVKLLLVMLLKLTLYSIRLRLFKQENMKPTAASSEVIPTKYSISVNC